MNFSKRLRRMFLILLAVYAALFALRLGYGFMVYPDGVQEPRWDNQVQRQSGADMLSQSKKNYASEKKYAPSAPAAAQSVDQKFEKTASISSKSQAFTEDEQRIRSLVQTQKAIIQDEQTLGNKGARQLHLIIGVNPDTFETFYEAAHKIGTVTSTSTNKQDKTNEYLALKAKRASLESTRAALIDLKKNQGRIDEFIQLQSRILEVEQELQNLGVALGDFDEVNAFCTVRFSLFEDKIAAQERISFAHRVGVAFFWATEYFVYSMGLLLLVLVTAFMLLVVLDRFRILARLLDRFDK